MNPQNLDVSICMNFINKKHRTFEQQINLL